MGRLNRLMGKPKDFVIKGETITVHPLKARNFDIIVDMQKAKGLGEQMPVIKKLVLVTLQRNDPAITMDDVEEDLDMPALLDMMNAIIEVNGLGDKIDKKKLMEALPADTASATPSGSL